MHPHRASGSPTRRSRLFRAETARAAGLAGCAQILHEPGDPTAHKGSAVMASRRGRRASCTAAAMTEVALPAGLTSAEAERQLVELGPNEPAAGRGRSSFAEVLAL